MICTNLSRLELIILDKIKEKEKVNNTLSELYNKRLENYYEGCSKLSDVRKISTLKNSLLKS